MLLKCLKQCLTYKNSINIRFCNCFFLLVVFLRLDFNIVKMRLNADHLTGLLWKSEEIRRIKSSWRLDHSKC